MRLAVGQLWRGGRMRRGELLMSSVRIESRSQNVIPYRFFALRVNEETLYQWVESQHFELQSEHFSPPPPAPAEVSSVTDVERYSRDTPQYAFSRYGLFTLFKVMRQTSETRSIPPVLALEFQTMNSQLEVNVEVNGQCGNETTLPWNQNSGQDNANKRVVSTTTRGHSDGKPNGTTVNTEVCLPKRRRNISCSDPAVFAPQLRSQCDSRLGPNEKKTHLAPSCPTLCKPAADRFESEQDDFCLSEWQFRFHMLNPTFVRQREVTNEMKQSPEHDTAAL
ncbi:hypothetical protein F2P81_023697 [Scophthalmus maximus]|uniref:Uncharacterized protein n=1 Tax=Scophthalmus maximus TaxID=52904 RepID=A0A6A4RS12_SCOMX|nr:hypothetical protein F2P81_023697 [Scophthalmus maximus]